MREGIVTWKWQAARVYGAFCGGRLYCALCARVGDGANQTVAGYGRY